LKGKDPSHPACRQAGAQDDIIFRKSMTNIRNIAIIAHVDHGKTTLVDAMIRQTKTKLAKEFEGHDLIMDSNELERERGITIFSKNASVLWETKHTVIASEAKQSQIGDRHVAVASRDDNHTSNVKINIIDTPGHADFGGEVERVLSMADGALLLVDAKEGPMPQTRFVLKHALSMGLRVIVVVNKIDKSDARINYVLDKTLDLFLELGADDQIADFPIIYASGVQGKAGLDPDLSAMTDISPLFEEIIKHIPPPGGDPQKPLQFLATTLSSDSHKGRIATGKIHNGSAKQNMEILHINRDGLQKKYRLTSLMTFAGLDRVSVDEAHAGDIIALSGIPDITIGETIADPNNPTPLPLLSIEQPTVKMTFSVNTSPFAGQEGEFKTSRQIRERLMKELETDMALRVEDTSDGKWLVSGRGELHLAILIERMRREGYELEVSRPQVVTVEENGVTMTPYEHVFLEVPEEYAGSVMQKMGARRGDLKDMTTENGINYLVFEIATKDLFGYRSEFLTDSRGLGIFNSTFLEYRPDDGLIHERDHGSLVAHESGLTNLYGLTNVQDRGQLFVGSGINVYKGQVIGQNARIEDLRVNVCKAKQLSNMRSKGEGTSVHFNTPRVMSLEDALEYVSDDELVEVTPKNIRIRKKILDEVEARRIRAQGK